jgi:hypothetical protein
MINMKCFFSLYAVLCAALIFSCAGLPPEKTRAGAEPEKAPVLPERPERPLPPENIMGSGKVSGEPLALFLIQNNPQADPDFARLLSGLYIEEAAAEGVNHDTAFAQMCLETGFLRYGGLVSPDMNNFCGLGAIGPEQPGLVFPDPRTGVRAHIQHLQAYASEGTLKQELVDPRYRYVRRGAAPTIHGLTGTWATDKNYSAKIGAILQRLYESSFSNESKAD